MPPQRDSSGTLEQAQQDSLPLVAKPFETVRLRLMAQVGRRKMATAQRERLPPVRLPHPALPLPVQSVPEALPQAAAQGVDLGVKSALGRAQDRHDRVQTLAVLLVRCARHSPAETAAMTTAAPRAKHRRARLLAAVG